MVVFGMAAAFMLVIGEIAYFLVFGGFIQPSTWGA
jgi:hypothetical protein